MVEHAVEIAIVFDYFFESSDFFDFCVIHECDVFVFEDFLPVCFFVEFLYGDGLSGFGLFCFEEGEPFSFDYVLENAIFLHYL